MKTIYKLIVGEVIYVGATSNLKSRYSYHEYMLRAGKHFNDGLQKAYNKFGKVECEVLEVTDKPNERESYYIQKYRNEKVSIVNVSGGVGLTGLKRSDSFKEIMSKRLSGENNPGAKLTNDQFYEIVELFKKDYSNAEIANIYNVHPNYISLIRHKKRFKSLWKDIDYTAHNSNGKKKFNYQEFLNILQLHKELGSIKAVAERYGADRSSISRIVNGKSYLDYWKLYESGSTTIETTV